MSRGGTNRRRKGPRVGPTIPNNRRLKKQHPFTDLSDRVCVVDECRTQIKTRLVILKDVETCYRHHMVCERIRRKLRA